MCMRFRAYKPAVCFNAYIYVSVSTARDISYTYERTLITNLPLSRLVRTTELLDTQHLNYNVSSPASGSTEERAFNQRDETHPKVASVTVIDITRSGLRAHDCWYYYATLHWNHPRGAKQTKRLKYHNNTNAPMPRLYTRCNDHVTPDATIIHEIVIDCTVRSIFSVKDQQSTTISQSSHIQQIDERPITILEPGESSHTLERRINSIAKDLYQSNTVATYRSKSR